MSDRSVVYQIYSTVRNRPLSANRALHLLNDDGCVDVICVACSGGCDSVFLVKEIIEMIFFLLLCENLTQKFW